MGEKAIGGEVKEAKLKERRHGVQVYLVKKWGYRIGLATYL